MLTALISQIAKATDQLDDNPNQLRLLVTGLVGEVGSVAAAIKKAERDGLSSETLHARLAEELGDLLWYLVRTTELTASGLFDEMDGAVDRDSNRSTTSASTAVLALAAHVGQLASAVSVGNALQQDHLRGVWGSCFDLMAASGLEVDEVVAQNQSKNTGRWPEMRVPHPLFDDGFPASEQLPRNLIVDFLERDTTVELTCNGQSLGDRITDNIESPDDYRFHDVFHLAYAAHLGWSPVLRSLLRRKRKSNRVKDECQDGARAGIIEEAVAATIFSAAKEQGYFAGCRAVDHDLLKVVLQLIRGYEVDAVAVWQWERAVLDGFDVFRSLVLHRGGRVELDLPSRSLIFSPPPLHD